MPTRVLYCGKGLRLNLWSVLLSYCFADPARRFNLSPSAGPMLLWWAQETSITLQLGTAPLRRIIHFPLQASRPRRGIPGQEDFPPLSSPYLCSTPSPQALNLPVPWASSSHGPFPKPSFSAWAHRGMLCKAVELQSKTIPCASTCSRVCRLEMSKCLASEWWLEGIRRALNMLFDSYTWHRP